MALITSDCAPFSRRESVADLVDSLGLVGHLDSSTSRKGGAFLF